ncbi:hypothetical protein QFZ24_001764 [Streptomyces phaeochromogenes]|jgi:hypothetical protein|uniref:hypothetical protein n=1 Tax=Streptomyces TaxID=1883 RepID=UPI00117C4B67|nr:MULTISPECIES: hypothetical protein [Streptomyces]MDQ0947841.1 hypothetical protein [Streptomyces phaeochromogenes]TRO67840.1 hypothetical protein E4K73_09875 [Streptomyces sp. IB201691-2A2]
MRAIRVASAALLGMTALTLTAPVAAARDDGERNITSFGFNVSPTTIAAGGRVSLSVNGCKSDTKVSSGVFDTVTIPKGQGSATATVDWDAKPGAVYEVTFQCGNESGHTDLTIATGRPNDPTPAPVHRGVKAGVGGSAGGFDAGEIGLGAALIAGSVGAAYYWSRRRAGEHGG